MRPILAESLSLALLLGGRATQVPRRRLLQTAATKSLADRVIEDVVGAVSGQAGRRRTTTPCKMGPALKSPKTAKARVCSGLLRAAITHGVVFCRTGPIASVLARGRARSRKSYAVGRFYRLFPLAGHFVAQVLTQLLIQGGGGVVSAEEIPTPTTAPIEVILLRSGLALLPTEIFTHGVQTR